MQTENLTKAKNLHAQGEIESARSIYLALITESPHNAELMHLLGVAEHQLGNHQVALELLDRSIAIDSNCAAYFLSHGTVLYVLKAYGKAIASFDRCLQVAPESARALYLRGNSLLELDRPKSALNDYEKAIALAPLFPEAYFYRGIALAALGAIEAAIDSYDKAIALKADFAAAYTNRGSLLRKQNKWHLAIANFDEAIRINAELAEAHANRGNSLVELKQYDDAISSYDAAIRLNPNAVDFHVNRGKALQQIRQYDAAIGSYETAIQLNPGCEFLQGIVLHCKMQLADWRCFDLDMRDLLKQIESNQRASPPFFVLAMTASPMLQLQAAATYADAWHPANSTLGEITRRRKKEKIRIGYYSSDFRDHAMSYLITALFETHDKTRFEVFGFSFGVDDNSPMRKRVASAFNNFIDVRNMSDLEVAALSRKLEIDIAVDLNGFTHDHRAGIFAHRAAPIQVNYLSYAGSMAVEYMDYLIADQTLIPAEYRKYYTEKIAYMPHSYQANIANKEIAPTTLSREEMGLPSSGFVFCCFNNTYKITPVVFDCWMRILHSVESSVLWLLDDNSTAVANLKLEAKARGISSDRIVFAQRAPLDEYFARNALADLFLDTLPYNAHTTASDALWSGLPVLTCQGEAFASRVAASLLRAIDLPELVTDSLERYVSLAVELGKTPAKLDEIRKRLHRNRASSPLFDVQLFAKNIEGLYSKMYERHHAQLQPEHIYMSSQKFIQMSTGDQLVYDLLQLRDTVQVMDVGASFINEVPVYKKLLDAGVAHLSAFDGDPRQIEKIKLAYGDNATVFSDFLADGSVRTLYIASEASGMTSLLRPRPDALRFFNGFEQFGVVERTEMVQTKMLDDLEGIPEIDFLKMDVQGSELEVMKHGRATLRNCVAVQLEVAYFCLYENQPTFGEVDVWMRAQGYVPHCFLGTKRWSISPTIKNGDFRLPFNQLLESDVVYIRDPLKLTELDDLQLRKLAAIAHYCLASYDLCVHVIRELMSRQSLKQDAHQSYLEIVSQHATG